MRIVKFTTVILLMLFLVAGIANSAAVAEYITTLKMRQALAPMVSWQESVSKYALNNNISPIEPKVDKVWKLIPGYNGLVVDQQATLELLNELKPKSTEEIIYIWKEEAVITTLQSLGAQPIYRGNPAKPSTSLMINVAWGTEYIEPILKILAEQQVKATFFLDGSWLRNNLETAKKIVAHGHEIGNHAYSHPRMSLLSDARIREEILNTEELLRDLTGHPSKYFAPPSGDFDQRVVDIAFDLEMYTVLWTLDTIDWQKPSPEAIINRIIPKVSNGHLILMHPTRSTVEALPELIRGIREKGLIILPVSETLSSKRILPVEQSIKF